MLIPVLTFVLLGLIEQVAAIQCYTCNEHGNNCPVPLYFDAGDESNENPITTANYDWDHACKIDRSWNPYTGKEKIILTGVRFCEEIDIDNHRVHCCYTDNCNNHPPEMRIKTLTDLNPVSDDEISDSRRLIASFLSVVVALALPYLV